MELPSRTLTLPSSIGGGDVAKYIHDVVWPAFDGERGRLQIIDAWADGNQPDYARIQAKSPEKRALFRLSKTPWLRLVVTTFAQCLYVSGYRREGDKENAEGPWQTWMANGMPHRQIGLHRSALTYGYAFAMAEKGTALDGSNQAVLTAYSPRRLFALYEDTVNDPWPKYALTLQPDGKTVRFWTDQLYYELDMPSPNEFPTPPRVFEHGLGVCPVVRYMNVMDLDGKTRGEVGPLIPVATRIDKTELDLLYAQHYNSFKVKTATGITDMNEATDEEAEAFKRRLENDDILAHTSEQAKFGTLDETPLDGFISSKTAHVETLAAVAQLPSDVLTGKLANLSAEALASARANTEAKLAERKMTFGASHNQLLRLSALVEGDIESASDFTASVRWVDSSIRSLAQAVDAWGKAAQMLGMPKEELWEFVPGVDEAKLQQMREHAMDTDDLTMMLRYFGGTDPNAKGAAADPSIKGVPGAQPAGAAA
ncbi:phage portal protein [Mycobacteroides abscessus]|uniref:phage portal protein n=1 Tax=Mycobacteroides abscessus TaxID=36809 RepID=UPI00092C284A|nr:phage portal protein [Mycobacteroides abscessus]UVK63390.1 portal protein [Mycobacterium phage Baudelaire]WKW86497.1 portal protein [Mycobacterium phage Aegeus]SIL72090.1 Phage portal protein, SPP1 Gp6 [Mycobacteroides abscessus subsp. abscessus]SKT45344.1 Phage portal protein, SPP1 Gp6 [Mycobacteroides abscessus subsp. bolletii]